MQERFTRAVERMNEAVHTPETDTETLIRVLEPTVGDGEVTEKLFFIQKQKALLMAELKASLQQLDEDGTVGQENKMRRVTYDEVSDTFVTFGKGGAEEGVRRGQLMVAGLWDEAYFLDASVPRDVQKKYLVQKTRYKIADLYDHQIALFESTQDYNKNTGFDDAYRAIVDRYSEDAEVVPGVMAEKMVESFITKLTYDYNMPYRLKNVSVYEDVEYKIDFLIEPLSDSDAVGVGVDTPEHRPDIAIQFTTALSPITIEHKHKQVSQAKGKIDRDDSLHVKDLILIVLPIAHVVDVFGEWQHTKKAKRVPGGPDELWNMETKENIFKGLLEKIFSSEQIEHAWAQVEHGTH